MSAAAASSTVRTTYDVKPQRSWCCAISSASSSSVPTNMYGAPMTSARRRARNVSATRAAALYAVLGDPEVLHERVEHRPRAGRRFAAHDRRRRPSIAASLQSTSCECPSASVRPVPLRLTMSATRAAESEHPRAVAADQQRNRVLHRPRRQQERVVDVHVPAVMRHDLAGQQLRHDVDRLDEPPDPCGRGRYSRPVIAHSAGVCPAPSPRTKRPFESTSTVAASLAIDERIADAHVEHVGAELQRRRDAGRGRERGERRGGAPRWSAT